MHIQDPYLGQYKGFAIKNINICICAARQFQSGSIRHIEVKTSYIAVTRKDVLKFCYVPSVFQFLHWNILFIYLICIHLHERETERYYSKLSIPRRDSIPRNPTSSNKINSPPEYIFRITYSSMKTRAAII